MDSRSTDQLDVELRDEDWIDVSEDPIENASVKEICDNKNSDTKETRISVNIIEEENPFRFSASKTREKATSTLSLEANINKLDPKRSLKFWDKWLKFFVLIGAGISVSVLCVVLIEEENKRVR